MQESTVLESVLRRDRLLVITGLVTVMVLSWTYLLLGAGMAMTACEMPRAALPGATAAVDMPGHDSAMAAQPGMGATMRMAHAAMMQPAVWTPAYAGLMGVMWWIMMIAMMLPSASPMILLFARVQRNQHAQGAPVISTGIFLLGYLVMWGAFSVLAAGTQWGLERAGLLSAMMESTSGRFAGLLLLVAGAYQLTPLKQACLRRCRSPLQFIMHHWRAGTLGACRMGVEHGAFCLACCWVLMTLLFVGGVMNLYWIVGLALFVLLEKSLPAGHGFSALTGVGLLVWGGWLVVGTFL